jgi:hypothetical protein
MFFHTDYRPLLRDAAHHVVDEQVSTKSVLRIRNFSPDPDPAGSKFRIRIRISMTPQNFQKQ